MKNVLFIVNPFSGIGRQKTIEQLIDTKLDSTKFKPEIIYTEHAGHAIDISKSNLKSFDIIVAVGGDGSVNEVCQHMIGTDTVMGIIPAGSGNGFARHLNLPLKPEKAFEVINNCRVERIDTAQLGGRKFVNIAGIGFDAEMGEKFATTKERGFNGYRKIVMKGLREFTPEKITLVADGKVIEKELFILSVANATQYGFNAKISPKSSLTDGVLDVVMLKKFPFAISPFLATRLFGGKILGSKYCETLQVKDLVIKTKKECAAHFDGEPLILSSEIKVSIIPKSLNIIVPEKASKF